MAPNIERNAQTKINIDVDENGNTTTDTTQDKFYSKDLPEDLKELLLGMNEYLPNDYMVHADTKPPWLDIEMCKKGQRFAQKYYFGLNYAEMLSLYFLFIDRENLGILIHTQKSHTPYKAFRRYLSTVLRVKSWFETEFWNPSELGYKNLKIVRAMHLNVSKRLNEAHPEEFQKEFSLIGNPKYEQGVWSSLTECLREDFSEVKCPMSSNSNIWSSEPFDGSKRVFINQFNMSMTQLGFVGLMLLYPDKFGASNASEEELAAFAHLWRAIGFYLGIQDRYNFCKGDLNEVKERCKNVLKLWVIPNLTHVTEDWEHMSRCMTEGISYYIHGVTFETSLRYLCWVLEIETPRLNSRMSYYQTFMFYSNQFVMQKIAKVPFMLDWLNWMIKFSIKKAEKLNPDWLLKLEERKYDFQIVQKS